MNKQRFFIPVFLTLLFIPFLSALAFDNHKPPTQRPVIYSQSSWEPLVFIRDHHISGMIADYLHLLENKTSLRFAYAYDNDWNAVLNRYDAGQLDILPGLIALDVPKNEIISKPIFRFNLVLAGSHVSHFYTGLQEVENEDLVIAVGDNSSIQHYLQTHYPNIKTLLVPTTQEGLMAVEHKKADLFLEMAPIVSYGLQNSGMAKMKIVGILKDSLPIVIAMKDSALLPIINQGIDAISEQELDTLYNRYIKVDVQAKTDYTLIMKILLVVLFVCLGFVMWLIILKREIRKRKLAEMKATLSNQRLHKAAEELKIAMAKTAHAHQAKSQFLANMSHEIRTPMNTIIGMTELILRKELPDKERTYLTKVSEAAHHLLDIINDILDFSKLEANKIQLESIPFHLEELILSVTDLTSIRAQQKGLELLIDLGNATAHHYKGDPLRLKQVLLNLVSNAIKFTAKGEVIIRVKAFDENDEYQHIRFEVIDTGIGIKPEHQAGLFNAFSQADMSTTRNYGGTGLGLSIAQGLIMMMGGEIRCESTYGQGSTFWFEIPLRIDSSFVPNPHTLMNKALKVLVVDDNETALEIFAEIFYNFGIGCVTCKDAHEALSLLQSGFHADVAIIDWKMKGLDGIALFHLIDEHFKHQIASIMMVTAYDKEDLIEQLGDNQPYAILVKPVTSSTLFDTLIAMYGHKRLIEPHTVQDQSKPKVAGLNVLVVEDNLSNQEVAYELLNAEGMIVNIASNGEEALEWLLKNPIPDIILMDCQMPILDGFETTHQIRTKLHLDIPILAMTANVMKGDQEKCYASGMDGYIAKPIDLNKLLHEIARFCLKEEQTIIEPIHTLVDAVSEGIDSDKAIERLGGNVTLYRQLLRNFAKEQPSFAQRYQEAAAANDTEGTKRLCHTLKGIAATLGMDDLFELAYQAEHSDHPISSALLKQINDEIHALIVRAKQLSQPQNVPTPHTTLSLQKLASLSEKLKSADATAIDDAAILEKSTDIRLREAYTQIKIFEFENAVQLIEIVMREDTTTQPHQESV
jgi:polar amino acid transport system substrate-binding protein